MFQNPSLRVIDIHLNLTTNSNELVMFQNPSLRVIDIHCLAPEGSARTPYQRPCPITPSPCLYSLPLSVRPLCRIMSDPGLS
jgi:hypothetical protein